MAMLEEVEESCATVPRFGSKLGSMTASFSDLSFSLFSSVEAASWGEDSMDSELFSSSVDVWECCS